MQISKSQNNSSPYASGANELAAVQGWTEEAETRTWTFVSANAAGNTFVVSVNDDVTSLMRPRMRVRAMQGADYQYFIVHKVELDVTNTTITLFGGADYNIAAGEITDVAWSTERFPYGFPDNQDKWTVTYSDNAVRFAGVLTNDTWTNINNASVEAPCAGQWEIKYVVIAEVLPNSAPATMILSVTRSDANNTSISTWEKTLEATSSILRLSFSHSDIINLTDAETYYLNTKYFMSGTTANYLANGGDISPTMIKAVSGYY